MESLGKVQGMGMTTQMMDGVGMGSYCRSDNVMRFAEDGNDMEWNYSALSQNGWLWTGTRMGFVIEGHYIINLPLEIDRKYQRTVEIRYSQNKRTRTKN